MPWLQITLTVEQGDAPLLEAVLTNAGALAVTLRDAGDDPQFEPPPGATPLWQGVRMTALFDADPHSRQQVESVAATLGPNALKPPLIEEIADRPWERVWLDDFRPTRFGARLWVCPQGQPAPDPAAVVVDLDPGLAFGTGHHPTTALCLEWLDGAPLAGATVLDFGCGSGILAIAAIKLGATQAIAVDHDPQAIEATRSNAQNNGVASQLHACLPGDLGQYIAQLPADLVLANILAGPLVALAADLTGWLRPGGALVLSGILEDQTPGILDAYGAAIDLAPPRQREDWMLIHGTKRIPADLPLAPPCP